MGLFPEFDPPAMRRQNMGVKHGGDFAYRKFLNRRVRAGHYFPCFRDFFGPFSTQTAVLLLHLVNVGQARADDDGFVQATPNFVESGTAIPPDAQDRILAQLAEQGVVEVELRGKMRFVRIDLARVEKIIKGDRT